MSGKDALAQAKAALAKAGFAGGRHGGFRSNSTKQTPTTQPGSAASGRSSGFGRDRQSPGAAPGGGFAIEDDEDSSISDFEFDAGGEGGNRAPHMAGGNHAAGIPRQTAARGSGGLSGWEDDDDSAGGGLVGGLDGGAPIPPTAAGLGDGDEDEDDESIELNAEGLGVAAPRQGSSDRNNQAAATRHAARTAAGSGGSAGRNASPVDEFVLEDSDSFGSSDARPLSPATLRQQAAARVAARRGVTSAGGVMSGSRGAPAGNGSGGTAGTGNR